MKIKRIKQVLMCKPLYFDAITYVINPWMNPGAINKERALEQWTQLVQAYEKLGITVSIINQEQGITDMVFASDQGIVQEKDVLLSRFWHDERRKESSYYEKWFQKNGYRVHHLPHDVYFEGNGDSRFWNDKLLIGIGYRADDKTCDAVKKIQNVQVIPLEIVDPKFYHLDVGFFPLNNETAFYYPPAFSQKSRGVLKKIVPNLIELSKEEAYGFCANSIVTDHHVIHQKDNPTF